MKWLSQLFEQSRGETVNPEYQRAANQVCLSQFSTRFTWYSEDSKHQLSFVVDLTGVRQDSEGSPSGQFDIAGEGYAASGRFYLQSATILVDINKIWVPETLKRKGLGTAFLVSIERAASRIHPLTSTQRAINVEGFFCDDGVGFASASCHQFPKPGQASQLLAARVQKAREQLQL